MLFYWERTKICEVQNNRSIYIMLSGKSGAKSSRDGANTLYNEKSKHTQLLGKSDTVFGM